MKNNMHRGGYTLVELIVAVGLFALVMLLASGAYIMMIGLSRQAQGLATGIDNLSFALETMTRSIRTGTSYSCGMILGQGDCPGGTSFSFKNENGKTVVYQLAGVAPNQYIQETVDGTQSALTDALSVTITSLTFYVSGTKSTSQLDYFQPHLTIVIQGKVSSGKTPQNFSIETGATMRGSDL